jgi:hypothetical protein
MKCAASRVVTFDSKSRHLGIRCSDASPAPCSSAPCATHGLVSLFHPAFENVVYEGATMVARGAGEVPIILWLLIKGVDSDRPTADTSAAMPA